MSRIRFGPAGFPDGAKGRLENVFKILSELNLNALEYAAVRGLRLSEERAQKIRRLSTKHDVQMTMHAAYYISLASKQAATRKKSKERLIKALFFAPSMGVKRVIFHPGSYSGLSKEQAFAVIAQALREVWEKGNGNDSGAFLAPETSGKLSTFGTPEEIARLCQEVDGCIPTIDWAHLYARTQGKLREKDDYRKIIEMFENKLGSLFVNNMHFHVSGIIFSNAGERSHTPLGAKWGPDVLPLLELVVENGYRPTIISETPTPIRGALYVKFLIEELEIKRND